MRRYLTLLVPSLYLLVSCTTDTTADVASAENIVNVYNWADYVTPDINALATFIILIVSSGVVVAWWAGRK